MPKSVTRPEDLFSYNFFSDGEPYLDRQLLLQALKGSLPGVDDLDLCDASVRLAREELTSFGTGGRPRLDDEELRLLLRACKAVCARTAIRFPSLPFWTFEGFRSFWKMEGMAWSYEARRSYLHRTFQPVEDEILRRSVTTWEEVLMQPVSPHSATGWSLVDAEIQEMRQKFRNARTEQEHAAIGLACVRILERVSEVAFDPALHWRSSDPVPTREKTKDRFEAIIDATLIGPKNVKMRKTARSIVELAQEVKHSSMPTRDEAGIAADVTIALVNMIRRLVGHQPNLPQRTVQHVIQVAALN